MLELLGEGLIYFCGQPWSGGDPSPPLSSDAAAAVIRGDTWRRIPLKVAEIWFEATPEGDRRMGLASAAGEWLGEASVAPDWPSPPQHE